MHTVPRTDWLQEHGQAAAACFRSATDWVAAPPAPPTVRQTAQVAAHAPAPATPTTPWLHQTPRWSCPQTHRSRRFRLGKGSRPARRRVRARQAATTTPLGSRQTRAGVGGAAPEPWDCVGPPIARCCWCWCGLCRRHAGVSPFGVSPSHSWHGAAARFARRGLTSRAGG